jgi:AmmeMemoRadiSam system protein A
VSPALLAVEDRSRLLSLARRAIAAHLDGHDARPSDEPEALRRKAAAFVTLKTPEGELRGCIGFVEPLYPLAETVARAAVAAASEDPRFPPVTQAELAGLRLDISVLGPTHEIDPGEVRVGTHGLVIQRGARRGLLLPQVPVEHGWDAERFLDHTCLKAGLPTGAWREKGTKLLAFEAEVFGDEEPPR